MAFPEHSIGIHPPFLVKDARHCSTRIIKRPIEKECASFLIKGLSPTYSWNHPETHEEQPMSDFYFSGYIKNRGSKVPISIHGCRPNITFSCFDRIFLFLYEIRTQKVFSTRFFCCGNWNTKVVKAKSTISAEFIDIRIDITNIRPGYHYNICQPSELDNVSENSILYNNESIKIHGYDCPLCFNDFGKAEELKEHINVLHMHAKAIIADGMLQISEEKPVLSVIHNEIGLGLEQNVKKIKRDEIRAIDFCEKYDSEDECPRNYFDFISGACIEESSDKNMDLDDKPLGNPQGSTQPDGDEVEAKISEDTSKLPKQEIKISYVPATSKIDLVKKLYASKSKGGLVTSCKVIDLFYLAGSTVVMASTTPRPASKKILDNIESYITAFFDNKEGTLPGNGYTFFKKRNSQLLDYKIQNYGLLVEKEFDTLDYTPMLANHLNLRLQERSKRTEMNEYQAMKEWNSFMVKCLDAKECLGKFLHKFALVDGAVKLIGLLYNRGVLSSKDIQDVLKEFIGG